MVCCCPEPRPFSATCSKEWWKYSFSSYGLTLPKTVLEGLLRVCEMECSLSEGIGLHYEWVWPSGQVYEQQERGA